MERLQLIDIIEQYSISGLPAGALEKVAIHFKVLQNWSRIFNLTGLNKTEDLAESLYLDSLLTSDWLSKQPGLFEKVHDVGSGAGFPGLFLPLFLGKGSTFVLHEAQRKKASFLRTAASEMGLSNLTVSNDRVIHDAFKADLVTSRATLHPQEWLELAATLLKTSGNAVAYLSESDLKIIMPRYSTAFFPPLKLKNSFTYTLPVSMRRRTVCLFERI